MDTTSANKAYEEIQESIRKHRQKDAQLETTKLAGCLLRDLAKLEWGEGTTVQITVKNGLMVEEI